MVGASNSGLLLEGIIGGRGLKRESSYFTLSHDLCARVICP